MRWPQAPLLALLAGLAASPALADSEAPPRTQSASVGSTNRGRLEHAVELRPSERIQLKDGARLRFGTAELVGLIERATAHVDRVLPGSRLTVGDLSAREGGAFPPHASHQSGRDADVGFYLLGEDDRPIVAPVLIRVRADGPVVRGGITYRFDVARNWELVAALATDDLAPVQHVFVAFPLRQAILRHGAESGAPRELLDRVDVLLSQPTDGGAHRSHFHVRIYCPGDDAECVDRPPYHPWVRPVATEPGEALEPGEGPAAP